MKPKIGVKNGVTRVKLGIRTSVGKIFSRRFFLLLAFGRLSNTGSQRKWGVRKLRETTSGENSGGHNKTPKTRNRNEKTKQNGSSFSYFFGLFLSVVFLV